MDDIVWFLLLYIICPFIVVVVGGLVVFYHKRIFRWLGMLLKKVVAFFTIMMFSPFRKGLGIQKINEKLTEIEETALYTIIKQIEIDERLAKLEEATRNPRSPSCETENIESGENRV